MEKTKEGNTEQEDRTTEITQSGKEKKKKKTERKQT